MHAILHSRAIADGYAFSHTDSAETRRSRSTRQNYNIGYAFPSGTCSCLKCTCPSVHALKNQQLEPQDSTTESPDMADYSSLLTHFAEVADHVESGLEVTKRTAVYLKKLVDIESVAVKDLLKLSKTEDSKVKSIAVGVITSCWYRWCMNNVFAARITLNSRPFASEQPNVVSSQASKLLQLHEVSLAFANKRQTFVTSLQGQVVKPLEGWYSKVMPLWLHCVATSSARMVS